MSTHPGFMGLGKAALAAGILAAGPATAQDDWNLSFAPYLWATGIDGDATIGNVTADLEVNFSDILHVLDGALLGHFEARKGGTGLFGDFIYLATDPEDYVEIDTLILEAGYLHGRDSGGGLTGWEVGVRYWDFETTIVPALASTIDRSESWIDGYVGYRRERPIGERWRSVVRGNIGAGGSDLAWGLDLIYLLEFDNEKLVESCIRALRDAPPIPKTRLQWRKADIAIGKAGVEATERGGAQTVALDEADVDLPDLLTDLQDRTQLTRRTIHRVLSGSGRLKDFKNNPQAFIELAGEAIYRCKRLAVVDGIKYQRLGDEHYYAQELFEQEELTGYLADRGLLVDAQEADLAEAEVPATIQDVLTARIDRLPDPTKRVLQVASVLGREFGYPLLAAVAEMERRGFARDSRGWSTRRTRPDRGEGVARRAATAAAIRCQFRCQLSTETG